MSSFKLQACRESVADWDALTDEQRTHIIRMHTPAIFGTERETAEADNGKPYDQLTGPELAELRRMIASMRATRARMMGQAQVTRKDP